MSLETVVALGRIAFGLMFAVKIYYSIRARELVWCHRTPTLRGVPVLAPLLAALAVANAAFVLGIASDLAALVQWAVYVWLWRAASLYGLEDISFHALSFYFVFAGAGAALSLDTSVGWALWGRLPADSVIPELWLATALGLVFLSAGVTKLPSAMWRRGLGAYFFFLLPNYRRLDTRWLTTNEFVARSLNWGALVMELGLLVALLVNANPFGLLFWIMAVGFTISLSTIFVLTWIGESMTVGLLIVLWLLLDTRTGGLGGRWIQELGGLHGLRDVGIVALLGTTLCSGLVTALVADAGWLPAWSPLQRAYRAARRATRFTWGLIPCEVFTEAHMQGPVVYRTFAVGEAGDERERFRIFGAQAGPGPARNLRPAFFEVTSYKVAEACMELDRGGEVSTPARRAFVFRLAEHIRRFSPAGERDFARLRFRVLQVVPPSGFAGATREYLDAPWVDAFDVVFAGGKATAIEPLSRRILHAETGRNLERISFEFDAVSH